MEKVWAAADRATVAAGKCKVTEVESESKGEPESPQKKARKVAPVHLLTQNDPWVQAATNACTSKQGALWFTSRPWGPGRKTSVGQMGFPGWTKSWDGSLRA
ncbi:hypothetical protein BU17DRAFT_102139 [Hysterangium stoloniferum]|nr:hypothetical protein BU17DRAFT_102139 [Hysterangium stoloniferum]